MFLNLKGLKFKAFKGLKFKASFLEFPLFLWDGKGNLQRRSIIVGLKWNIHLVTADGLLALVSVSQLQFGLPRGVDENFCSLQSRQGHKADAIAVGLSSRTHLT